MAGHFTDEFLDEVRARNDLVQIVSQYVPLQQKSRRYWGCCPFHSEKTPSFSVDPDKQFYYCFGCHEGGNVIHFIMNMEKRTFPEAVQFLAEKAGLPLPQTGQDSRAYQEKKRRKQRLYEALRQAALFYHRQLSTDGAAHARAYLEKRGLTQKEVKHFGLGYAPKEWQGLTDHLTAQGFTLKELSDAGLAVVKGEKKYDFFRDKLIFPIIDQQSRVLGFGGRLLSGDGPKYINTAETLVYNKREMLYGLNFYRQFGKERELFMTEGYMDCISVSSFGFPNVVASLGTALTTGQVRLLRRFADTVYFAYDGDAAGQNATLRGLDIAEKEGVAVRVLVLPDGQDPDEFLRSRGASAFRALKESALTLTECKIQALTKAFDMQTENGRTAFAQKAAALLRPLSPVERERYERYIAKASGFAVETIQQQAQSAKAPKAAAPPKRREAPAEKEQGVAVQERVLCALAEDAKTAVQLLPLLRREDFTDPLLQTLYIKSLELCAKQELSPAALLASVQTPEDAKRAAQWFVHTHVEPPDVMLDYLCTLRVQTLLRENEQLSKQPGDDIRRAAQTISQNTHLIAALKQKNSDAASKIEYLRRGKQ